MLDRREFVLRLSDIDKLRLQIQRCWSYVQSHAGPTPPPLSSPLPNVVNGPSASSAPGRDNPASRPTESKQSNMTSALDNIAGHDSANVESGNGSGFMLKAGLRREDLKPPPTKHRRIASSANSDTHSAGRSPAAVYINGTYGQAQGTGQSYASPIAIDSPSPRSKNAATQSQPTGSLPVRSSSQQARNAPSPKYTTLDSANPQSKALKSQSKAPVAKASPAKNEATDADVHVPPLPQPNPAELLEIQRAMQERQNVSLKRKREEEEAKADPAAFTERILSSMWCASSAPTQPSLDKNMVAARVSTTGFEEFLSAELLDLMGDDPAQPNLTPVPGVIKNGSDGLAASALPDCALDIFVDFDVDSTHNVWFNDPSNALTPDLTIGDDPTKTSPPDNDLVATPLDPLQNSKPALLANNSIPIYDQEYATYFGPSATLAPAPDNAFSTWNWSSGLVSS